MISCERLQGVPENIQNIIKEHQFRRTSLKNNGAGDGWVFTSQVGRLTRVTTNDREGEVRIGTGRRIVKLT